MFWWLTFVPALAILIVVHEYGHYRVARACGVKVLRFSVGFGQVLWRRQATPGSTEFTLCALPIGGYVRMLDEREGTVAPEELSQAFNRRPLWQRVAVVLAGPLANLLLAVLLLTVVAWIGGQVPDAHLGTPLAGTLAEQAGLRAGDFVRATSSDGQDWRPVVSRPDLQARVDEAAVMGQPLQLDLGNRRVRLATEQFVGQQFTDKLTRQLELTPLIEPLIGTVQPGGAADRAGLRAGDRVLSIDGELIADWGAILNRIRADTRGAQGEAMHWRIERAGVVLALDIRPKVQSEGGEPVGKIGAALVSPQMMVLVRFGPLDGLKRGALDTWNLASFSLRMIGKMLSGQVSVKNLSGAIGMAEFAGQAAQAGVVVFLGYMALISVSLGVLNLLPVPMLDGGHLMYYLFEGLTGRPVSEWWQERLQRAGALILFLLMVLALSNDMVRKFSELAASH